jgi:CRP/FNR family cyclic AMP-dependent transcriptional regulator
MPAWEREGMRKAFFFFGILSDTDIDWMLAVGHRETVRAGSRLIAEGAALTDVYVVIEGTLAVSTKASGAEIARLRAGELVGELSFVDARPPSATITAVEDSVVLALPVSVLAKRLEQVDFAARFYRALAVFLADRLRTTVGRLGYGRPEAATETASEDELNPAVLEKVALAGARFDQLRRRVQAD